MSRASTAVNHHVTSAGVPRLRPLSLALLLGSMIWVAVLIATPLVRASTEAASDTGTPPAIVAVYHACGRICHQRTERSFALAGAPLPVCARCFGLYMSVPLGVAIALRMRGRLGSVRWREALLVSAIPTLVTVALEWSGLADPGNVGRALASVPVGAAVATLVTAVSERELK
jgi:uncharacterized membrane protein